VLSHGWIASQLEVPEEDIRKAMLRVCAQAHDVDDARFLLEALGLIVQKEAVDA
jgi:hypothetical protein